MKTVRLRFTTSLSDLSAEDRAELLQRGRPSDDDLVRDTVGAIIDVVRYEGDTALRSLTREYDHVVPKQLEVPKEDCIRALAALPREARAAMERSFRNLRTVHAASVPSRSRVEPEPGIVVERIPIPLNRIGIHVPGGDVPQPSAVLTGAVPARIAGVGEVIVCSAPARSGLPAPGVLAACALAEVDRVFAVGGAASIAAMAQGTATIPQVDRIVGPGNAWVAAAKLMVADLVAVDAPCGSPGLMVVADASADVAHVAREMIAQAEHEDTAPVLAVVLGSHVAARVRASLVAQAAMAERKDIVRMNLEARGGVLSAQTRDEAMAFVAAYAPERLLLCVEDPDTALPVAQHASSIVMGSASIVLGEYVTGANSRLPAGRLVRSYSALSTADFVRWITRQTIEPSAAQALAVDASELAVLDGLPAHARAARALEHKS